MEGHDETQGAEPDAAPEEQTVEGTPEGELREDEVGAGDALNDDVREGAEGELPGGEPSE